MFRIEPAQSEHERQVAIRLLCSQEPPESGQELSRRLLDHGPRPGIFLAWLRQQPVGSVLAENLPGRAGTILPPRVDSSCGPVDSSAAERLLGTALEYLRRSGAEIAQALVPAEAEQDIFLLATAAFERYCELLFLTSRLVDFPTAPPAPRLQFESYSRANHARLVRVIEETYQGTWDCPKLNGQRDVEDVLAGYQAIGLFDPARWLLVRSGGRDVGCLLLTAYSHAVWELTYQGIIPRARGRGLGIDVVRHGQWLAAREGAEQLLVAVDAENDPALRVYAAAGFRVWEQRTVFARPVQRAA